VSPCVNRASRRARPDPIALAVFALALGVRLVHVWLMRESPFFDNLLVDSVDYDARAAALLAGGWPEEGAFYQAPLYPLFLSGVYALVGRDLLVVRIVQAFLGAGSAALVYLVGRRCVGAAAGAAGGAIYGLYAMAVHFDGEILRPSLVIFLSTLGLHLALAARGRGAIRWGAAGLVLGLASIARPTVLAFLPLALLWIGFANGRGRGIGRAGAPAPGGGAGQSHGGGSGDAGAVRRGAGAGSGRAPRAGRLAALALYAGCALAPVAAVTCVNYAKSGSFVLVSYNGGINFYIGNNEDYERTVATRPGVRWDLLTSEPGVDRRTDPAGWSRYYYGKAKKFIFSHPGDFVLLLVKKFVLFWNAHEIERNASFANAARYCPLLAHPVVTFGWVAPLAIAGMVLAGRRRAGLGLPALFLASQVAVTVAFFVCSRYRMISVPMLSVFAGYALAELARTFRRAPGEALPYLAIALLAAACVNADAYGVSRQRNSRPEYELAMVLRREGRTAEAARLLARAAEADPKDPDPHFQLGVLLAGRGAYADAADQFRAAALAEPRYARSWYNLGLTLSRAGSTAAAAEAYERALEVQPDYWEAAVGLGDALVAQKKYRKAVDAYRSSAPMARSRREAAVSSMSLGRALALSGDYEGALEELDRALALSPRSTDAMLAKARVLAALDRTEEAKAVVAAAAAADTSDTRVREMAREFGLEK